MSTDWTPIFVLLNIPLQASIGCEVAALAPADDPRVTAVTRAHPNFRRFLKSFSDNFGEMFEPAVLILQAGAPTALRQITALASFRDIIAISTVPYNRALELRQRRNRIVFGEAFAIYPWMLDRHYEHVIGSTPGILGIHDVTAFKGQSSPTLFRTPLNPRDMDQPLLTALMQRWQRRYKSAKPTWTDIALLRSLNMAYHASLLPAATDTTFYDVGRMVSLWVSAFEILVHPGGTGHANRDKVFELIERTPWALKASGVPSHDTGGKTSVKRSLASWLYQSLYECRNDFLHGNPVERADLTLPNSQRMALEYAAPLYRLALTSYLPLTHNKPAPPITDAEAFGAHVAERIEFLHPQESIEEAVLTATQAGPTNSATDASAP